MNDPIIPRTKNVVILQGVSGAGKSTYAKMHFPEATIVSADHYFTLNGSYTFDHSKLSEAHRYCWQTFLAALERGDQTIVVDNTNTTAAEISPYVLPAESFGYTVEIITLQVDPSVGAQRNIHGVDERTVKMQFDRLVREQKLFPPKWKHRIIQNT